MKTVMKAWLRLITARSCWLVVLHVWILALLLISIRLLYVCVFQSSYYLEKAQKLHERERDIKALRGEIL